MDLRLRVTGPVVIHLYAPFFFWRTCCSVICSVTVSGMDYRCYDCDDLLGCLGGQWWTGREGVLRTKGGLRFIFALGASSMSERKPHARQAWEGSLYIGMGIRSQHGILGLQGSKVFFRFLTWIRFQLPGLFGGSDALHVSCMGETWGVFIPGSDRGLGAMNGCSLMPPSWKLFC